MFYSGPFLLLGLFIIVYSLAVFYCSFVLWIVIG